MKKSNFYAGCCNHWQLLQYIGEEQTLLNWRGNSNRNQIFKKLIETGKVVNIITTEELKAGGKRPGRNSEWANGVDCKRSYQ